MAIKRIGVLTSGGDAPGMNPCVRSVVRTAIYHGIECYGIRRGWHGLINGDIIRLDEKNIGHIINRGGTILYTARSKEFMTEEGQRKAVSTCKFLGLDGIIAIGGDGTFRGAQALSRYGINCIDYIIKTGKIKAFIRNCVVSMVDCGNLNTAPNLDVVSIVVGNCHNVVVVSIQCNTIHTDTDIFIAVFNRGIVCHYAVAMVRNPQKLNLTQISI